MIARRRFATAQHDIAPDRWIGPYLPMLADRAGALFFPVERPGAGAQCGLHVEPPGIWRASGDAAATLPLAALAVGVGIKRRTVRVARPCPAPPLLLSHGGAYLAAAHEGRIDKTRCGQSFEGRTILVEMIRLTPHRLFPFEPEPG